MHAQWVLFIFLSKSYIVAPSWCLWWTYFPMCFLVFTKICLIIWSLNKYPPCWSFKLSKSNQFKVDIKSKTGLMWNADMWLTNLPFKNSMHNTESFQMWNQIAKFNSRKLITTRWIDLHQHNINAITTYFSAVQFNVRMGPDHPVSYSQSHGPLKFLMTKSIKQSFKQNNLTESWKKVR